ncbi:MAG: ribosomal protein S18-alanine N-acetyltransferase [Smithellaceae bacterium]|nr:ribosomal protein S18-alanine N-acetyltransferase [Syntrophaceae bacterium]MDD4241687.1 ribosomal protein S18-alanine N-acetyltransferase [Smithellaceae bacterium]NLX51968.1 ribosomal protein S18-alanine N-acetyltransferase [Deltaproteobacteria bacterium]
MSSEQTAHKVSVDLMQRTDLPEILAIERVSFPSPWTEGMFLDELRIPQAQKWVVKIQIDGKSLIGAYIVFWLVADEAHLHNLAVRKEFRRHGLAYNLLQLMKQTAAQMGIAKRTLEVRASNQPAIGLYRKCGFVIKGRRPKYYTDTNEDALIMWADG